MRAVIKSMSTGVFSVLLLPSRVKTIEIEVGEGIEEMAGSGLTGAETVLLPMINLFTTLARVGRVNLDRPLSPA